MKNILIISFIFLSQLNYCFSQKTIIVYKTYKEYLNNSGTVYKGNYMLGTITNSFGNISISFYIKGKLFSKNKLKFKIKEDWGYKINDELFVNREKEMYYVASIGKHLVYYEYYEIHLKDIFGIYCDMPNETHLSKKLNSEMKEIPISFLTNKIKRIKLFLGNDPNYNSLYKCIDSYPKSIRLKSLRECIINFNEEE